MTFMMNLLTFGAGLALGAGALAAFYSRRRALQASIASTIQQGGADVQKAADNLKNNISADVGKAASQVENALK